MARFAPFGRHYRRQFGGMAAMAYPIGVVSSSDPVPDAGRLRYNRRAWKRAGSRPKRGFEVP
jgi:hypothetical protein